MIGLKRGTVDLTIHEKEWEYEANKTIKRLKEILGDIAIDIQHVGSTAINTICAKPIIDIAVGVVSFNNVIEYKDELENNGFYYRNSLNNNQLLFACGNYYEGTGELQTHFIHVVIYNTKEWNDYINFRDYLNTHVEAARRYEEIKIKLATECPVDKGREKYTAGKSDFIKRTISLSANIKRIGQSVNVIVDRPAGSKHPKYDIIYAVNYGYIKNIIADDGEEQDAYILGVSEPINEFYGKITAVIHRLNDIEDKLVVLPEDKTFTAEEIKEAVNFQEQFFETEIIFN